ncbi:hypothetical protein IJD15_02400 [bacterium]|nr:hypothetical protein [Clostridia bacterium]MBQ4078014.1 hypothetical protein [bacterium]
MCKKNDKQNILEKEIDLIQSCITRMANNSFLIKGWLVSLIAVGFALLPETFNMRALCIISLLVCLCFWYLDGFFLKMEKLYRWKYEWVISNRLTTEDYSYNLNPYESNMWLPNKNNQSRKVPSILRVMFTKTLLPLYLPIIVTIIFMFVNSYKNWI